MTKLPPPEQWALCKMDEMEVAEMIEEHIDFYVVDEDGNGRSVHLPMPFVRHYVRRARRRAADDRRLCHHAAGAGGRELLAPPGLDRKRGIQFIIPDELRAIIPKREDCTPERVKARDEVPVRRVAGRRRHRLDRQGRARSPLALTIIERSLLDRPAVLLRHRRSARQRQDHGDPHADHGRHRAIRRRPRRGRRTRRSGARR